MKISILHLSDIHLKKNNNSIFKKKEKIFDAIKNEIIGKTQLFILITGDIAFSGTNEEYNQAEVLLDYIEDNLLEYNKDISIEYVFTAGNHDCDFSKNNKVREFLSKESLSNCASVDKSVIDSCTEIQDEYFKFINKYNRNEGLIKEKSNNIFTRYEFKIKEFNIAFNSYNTAWISKKNEVQSEIVYPLHLIDSSIRDNSNFNLTVSLHHHPLHWLSHKSIRELDEFINSSSSLVLTGHEHSAAAIEKSDLYKNQSITHIEGATLQDSQLAEESTFNLIKVDLSNNTQENTVFKWNNEMYESNIKKNFCLIEQNRALFNFNKSYKESVEKNDIKIKHPRKNTIGTVDLYIYPDLETIGEEHTLKISTVDIMNLNHYHEIIIYGADNSGKSSLAKILQINFKNENLVPLLINGQDFRKKDYTKENVKRLLLKTFKSQYDCIDSQCKKFEQLDYNKIVIIIDDFENCKMDNVEKGYLVESISKSNFGKVVIFANESIKLEATSEGLLANKLNILTHYSLLEFGHKLKDKIVKKWILLEQEEICKNKLLETRREYSNIIDKTLGLNLVPSFPLYILTLLQSIESSDTHSIEKSAYGNYYNYLILKYLNEEKLLNPNEQNIMFTYISSLAYKMFSSVNYEFNELDMEIFDNNYKKEKRITPTFNLRDKSTSSGILINNNGKHKFSQKYIYYYFVAHYFAQNIDRKEILETINKMIKRLYRTEFANILMFILHLSTKTELITRLLNEANSVFLNINEFTFDKSELTNINKLIKKDTMITLDKRTPEDSRNMELEEKEANEIVKKKSYVEDKYVANIDENIPELDFFNQINLGNRLIEITGEVIKNYAGTLDGDISESLIRANYGLGLKNIRSVIGLFEDEHNLLIEVITNLIKKRNVVRSDKIEEAVIGIVFTMSSSYSHDIIKKIAKSVGTKELKSIYNDISKNDIDNIAYKLIQIAIDLDFRGGLNKSQVIKLHDDLLLQNNGLTDTVLKRLVLNHLYMHEVDYNKKDSLCKQLGIDSNSSKKEELKQLMS